MMGEEALRATLRFFDYDRGIPLNARVVARLDSPEYVREKIVFSGGRGDRVPGYLGLPTAGEGPYPVVLALHGGNFSKESWWLAESFERGGLLTDALLRSGIAVLALDAQYHGERAANNDYLPLEQMYFEHGWFARYRDMLVESVMDWRRALDYLESRPEIDMQRIGIIGHSTGGIMAAHLAALDARIGTIVLCVAALSEDWLYPLQPVQFAARIDKAARVLVLAGRSDPLINVEDTQRFFTRIGSEQKELRFYDSGHELPEEYLERALAWLRAGLL